MGKPDGVVRFSTEMDNSELAKQVEDAKKEVESVEEKIKQLSKDRTSALKEQAKAQDKLKKAQEEYNATLGEAAKAADKAEAAQAAYRNAQAKQDRIVSEMNASRSAAEKTKLSAELNEQMGAVAQTREQWEAATAAASQYDAAIERGAQNVAAAESNLRNAKSAVSGIDANISSAEAALGEAEEKAGGLESELRDAQRAAASLKKPIELAEKAFGKFTRRISRIIASALIFNVLRSGIQELTSYYGKILAKNSEFTAQVAKLKGAFYAAFQPIFEYAVPLLNSLIKIATTALQIVGTLFAAMSGKSYKEVLENAQALYEQANATEELGDAAKKASKYIAGFDELNVITGTDSSSDDTSDSTLSDIVPDFGEVDLGGLGAALQPVGEILGEIAGAVESMSDGILAVVGVFATAKLFKSVKSTWTKIKGLNISKYLKTAEGNVSSIGVAASALAGYFEWSTIKDAISDLASESENAGSKILAIGTSAAGAATVMYSALGPAGIAMAAVVGLAGAIAGANKAMDDLMELMADEAFYSGTGAKISELGKAFEDVATQIAKPFEALSESVEDITSSKAELEETSKSIGSILQAFEDGYEPTSDEVDKLKDLFESLRDSAKETMSQTYDYLYNSVTGALSGALADAGSSSAEVLAVLKKLRGEAEGELEELSDEFDALWGKFENDAISSEEFAQKAQPILERINELSGISANIDVSGTFSDLLKDVGNIDWEDDETVEKFFESIATAATNAQDTIGTATKGIISAMEDAVKQARALGHDDLADYLESTIGSAAEAAENAAYADLETQLNALFDAIQKDAVLKSQTQFGEAETAWRNLNPSTRRLVYGNNSGNFIKRSMDEYSSIVDEISEKIEKAFEDLSIDGSAWASDAMKKIIASMFGVSEWTGDMYIKGTIEDAIEDAFEELGVSGAEAAAEAGKKAAESYTGEFDDIAKDYFEKWKRIMSGELNVGLSASRLARSRLSLDFHIPALAEGRVLPANHPFLAMVGDQKHGTNVEAPLSVIQDAMALVNEDNVNAMIAGFEALQQEMQLLRAAVEGIEVGDSTIGQAANRYNQRMAIIRG